jgi:hypothetical protein
MYWKLSATLFAFLLICGCTRPPSSAALEQEWKAEVIKRGAPFKAERERLLELSKKPGITEKEWEELDHKMQEVGILADKNMERFREEWNAKHPESPMPTLEELGVKRNR